MLSKLLLIFSGSAGAAFLSLMRNLLIASLIPVEDYGIAATFAVAMSAVEMLSAFGMQQQIVQSSRGEDPAFQNSLQGFHLFRGVISAAVLFFAADWIAAFLNIPHVAWAYQVMALVPILNGLQHFDIHRLKRQMRFGPFLLWDVVPVAISLTIVWPLALWLGDYRVVLGTILLEMTLRTVVSHLVAERSYRVTFDTTVVRGALHFGWPLLINNILLFGVLNGEKLIVGRLIGMETLAILAMGFTLTLTPTLVLDKTLQNFFLPQLSAAQYRPKTFIPLASAALQAALLNGCFVILGIAALGEIFVTFALSDGYAQLATLIVWMGLLNAIRVFKSGAATVALAKGQTANPMIANSFRVASLPLAAWAAASGQGLLTIIWIATAAEICGALVAFTLVWRRCKVPLGRLIFSLLATLTFLTGAGLFAGHAMLVDRWPAIPPQWTIGVALGFGFICLVATTGDLRRHLKRPRTGRAPST